MYFAFLHIKEIFSCLSSVNQKDFEEIISTIKTSFISSGDYTKGFMIYKFMLIRNLIKANKLKL